MSGTLERLTAALADHYRVERELGMGGMATVYLAHDLKHDREVAIKVLHPDLGAALGSERFLAEIKTTAKLQHPHILPLLDSGEADGLLFYVMPLVEGETLRTRLERERQLPVDSAIRIASEVAGALDYAHRHGVIHRDIKPENVLLHDGRAVVADFGIALAVSAASGSRMTQTGLSLGTPQYMSPEQAMGDRQIDARSDIYAIGAVLYEMLTGEPPFSGATVQAIVAKVLTEKPMRPTAVRDAIPPHVETTLLKALAKLPADRFATAAEFADALAHPEATAGLRAAAADSLAATAKSTHALGSASRVMGAPVAWTIAALSLSLAAFAWFRGARAPERSLPVVRALLPTVAGVVPSVVGGNSIFGISNDGSRVAFTGVDSANTVQLFVQRLDAPAIATVPNSAFATGPFFSPAGDAIGYFRSGRMFIVSLGGGTPTEVAPAVAARGGAWNAQGTIVYGADRGLHLVPAAGGTSSVLALPADPLAAYRNPAFIGNKRIVFDVVGGSSNGMLATLSLADRKVTVLAIAGIRPAFIDGGVLAYATIDGSLWAVEFDGATGRVTGKPRVVTNGVSLGGFSSPRLAIAPNGTTALMGGTGADDRELVLVDHSGRASVIGRGKGPYRYPRFSPDGRRLVFGLMGQRGPASGDIWTLDISSRTLLRVTSDSSSYHPEWDRDGKAIIFIGRRVFGAGPAAGTAASALFRVPVDATSPPVLVADGPAGIWESQMTPDRRTIVFRMDGTTTGRDIYTVPVDSPALVRPLVNTKFDEYGPAVSPDGRWLAYVSTEAGTAEVYVRRMDPSSPRWRVSRSGGSEPRWARTGEIFFRSGDSVLVSRVVTAAEPQIGAPQGVLAGKYDASNFEPLWDVSPDGRQFVFVRPIGNAGAQITVLLNWLDAWRAAKP